MQSLREFGGAFLTALISIGLMIGALSISLVEFVPKATSTPTDIQLPSPLPLTATETTLPSSTSPASIEPETPGNAPSATITATLPSNCNIPSGWTLITVQAGETIQSIADRYRTSADILRTGNCLASSNLVAGTKLYVPPVATNTSTVCTPGAVGWTKSYTVKPGDNLYRIAVDHYTTLNLIRSVNCKVGDVIHSGEVLWVPNVASRTPNPTSPAGSTATPYPTEPLTETVLPFTATFSPTNTPIPPTSTSPPSSTASGSPTIAPP